MIEEFIKLVRERITTRFEGDINQMHNANRASEQGRATYLAGRCDGLSEGLRELNETYKLFNDTEQKNEEVNATRKIY